MVNKTFSTELLDFINEAPTPYHAVGLMRNYLLKHGYEELYENDSWLLKKKGKYLLTFLIKDYVGLPNQYTTEILTQYLFQCLR